MKKVLAITSMSALTVATTAHAGIMAIPSAAIPVDSPWMLVGLAALLAVVGGRILHNRRK